VAVLTPAAWAMAWMVTLGFMGQASAINAMSCAFILMDFDAI
jgi:hypothetical protein